MTAQPRKMSEIMKEMSEILLRRLYGLVRTGEREEAIRFLQETQGVSRNEAMRRVAQIAAQLGIE